MATLTWRNVDAPSFQGATSGIELATRLLGNATGGLDRSLANFQQSRVDRADNQVLRNMLSYQDPAQYQQALMEGAVMDGANPQLVSADALIGLGRQTGTLQDQRATDQRFREDRFDFGVRQRTDADSQTAIQAINNVLRSSGSVDDARIGVESMAGSLTPGALALVREGVNRQFPGLYGPVGAGGGSAGGLPVSGGGGQGVSSFGSSPELTRAAGITLGGGQLPSNIRTIGDLVSNKEALVKANGGTPTGLFQITADTWADFGPKVLGANWKDADVRDPAVQDQVARAIWDSAKDKGSSIKGRWDSLTPAEAERMVGQPWEQVRGIIAQKESGIAPNALAVSNAQANAAGAMIGSRLMQNQATGISADYGETMRDTKSSPADVATRMSGKDGTFSSEDRGFLIGRINKMIEDSRVDGTPTLNAATAGAILERSIGEAEGGLASLASFAASGFGLFNDGNPNLSNGIRLNDDVIDAEVNRMRTGQTTDQALVNEQVSGVNQAVEAARTQYTNAQAMLQQQLLRAQTQPALAVHLPRYEAQVQAAQAALQRAIGAQRNSAQLNPVMDRTEVPQPVARTVGNGNGLGVFEVPPNNTQVNAQQVLRRALEW